MFIGREQELKRLNMMYASGKPEVAVIYGRRRVGKTTLINEFCRGKPTVFFAALENSSRVNLEALSDAIAAADQPGTGAGLRYRTFADALKKLREMALNRRLVFVIDEYPYLAKAEPGFSSLLQNFLDHEFRETGLFLILCGSSMSFMEHQVLGYQSPLYGRRTGQFKILPFDYLDTGRWFPSYSCEDRAVMYGITGGVPLYLEQFSAHKTIRENLLDSVFNKNAMLFEEPSNLLKQELREPAAYNAIITAIASGKSKLSEIAGTAGMETGPCSKYIGNLISLGIVRREVPITAPHSKRPVYQLEDLFFRFWYGFVPRNMAAIVSGRIEQSYEAAVGSRIPEYMGLVFEKMCRDYLLYYDERLPFLLQGVGQWWGGHPRTHRQAQIDVVVTSAEDRSAIVGSCKFKNEAVPESELDLLRDYAEAMGGFGRYYYYLFSKGGFSDALRTRADGRTVRLIPLNELYEPADHARSGSVT